MGFRLGDHEFLDPDQAASLERMMRDERAPIGNAPPPAFLEGMLTAADPEGPSAMLADGCFCGHGEPTYTVFDVSLGDHRWLELALPHDDAPQVVRIRDAEHQQAWQTLFALHEVFPESGHPEGDDEPEPLTDEDGADLPLRVAIGFEYPPDATSAEDISWIALAVETKDGRQAVVFSWETA